MRPNARTCLLARAVVGVLGAFALLIGSPVIVSSVGLPLNLLASVPLLQGVTRMTVIDRLLGLIFVTLGVALVVFSFISSGTRQGQQRALSGCLLGSIVGSILFYAQVAWSEPNVRILIWFILIVLPLGLAGLLYRAGVPLTLFRNTRRTLGSAAWIGVLLALAQVWYTTNYLPNAQAASLSITTGLELLSDPGDPILEVAAKVQVKNNSGSRVQLLGSIYRLSGVPVPNGPRGPETRTAGPDVITSVPSAARSRQRPDAEVLEAQDRVVPFREGSWLDPGQEVSRQWIGRVPGATYHTARLETIFYIAKGNKLELAREGIQVLGEPLSDQHPAQQPPPAIRCNRDFEAHALVCDQAGNPRRTAGYTYFDRTWPVQEDGGLLTWVVGRSSAPRELRSWWVLDGPADGPYPLLMTYIESKGAQPEKPGESPFSLRMAEVNEFASIPSLTEISLSTRRK